MKFQFLTPILAVACVILAVLLYIEQGRSEDLKREIRDAKVDLITRPASVSDEINQYQRRIEQLESELAARPPISSEDEPTATAAARPNPLENMSELMENPAMEQMMRSQNRGVLEPLYRDLFLALELSEEEQEHLMELLLDHQLAGVQQSLRLAQASPDERNDLLAEIKASKDAVKEQIKVFMNNEEDFAFYEEYSKQIPERQQISTMENAFNSGGVPLSDEQRSLLVAAMYEERTNYEFDHDFGNSENPDLNSLTDANAAVYLQQLEEVQASTLERARQFLDEAQLAIFEENQSNIKSLQESSLRMSVDMFGPAEDQE